MRQEVDPATAVMEALTDDTLRRELLPAVHAVALQLAEKYAAKPFATGFYPHKQVVRHFTLPNSETRTFDFLVSATKVVPAGLLTVRYTVGEVTIRKGDPRVFDYVQLGYGSTKELKLGEEVWVCALYHEVYVPVRYWARLSEGGNIPEGTWRGVITDDGLETLTERREYDTLVSAYRVAHPDLGQG